MNIFLKHVCCVTARLHTNAHIVRGRPTPKKEIRRFWNGLVRELIKTVKGIKIVISQTTTTTKDNIYVQSPHA